MRALFYCIIYEVSQELLFKGGTKMFDLLKSYEKEKAAKENYRCLLTEFTPDEISDALLHLCCGREKEKRMEDIIYEPNKITGEPDKVLVRLYDAAKQTSLSYGVDVWNVFNNYINQTQLSVQINKWKKTKQVFLYKKDLINELIETDPESVIQTKMLENLPGSTFYVDFTDNEELCNEIKLDGILVDVTPVVVENKSRFCLSTIFYRDGKARTNNVELSAKNTELITVNKMVDDFKIIFEKIAPQLSEKDYEKLRKIMVIKVMSVLYLSMDKIDLREKRSSVVNRQQARKNKISKSNLPPDEYEVGVRFGAAFRKWTIDASNQEKGETTGKHVRPHFRRAHVQRYYVGPKDAAERQYVWRWKHPCLVGLEEKDAEKKLDVVKHKLDTGDDKKQNHNPKKKKKNGDYPF